VNKNNRKSNETWKAYEPNKVTPDERQAELKNFASTIPRKAEISNSRVLPKIKQPQKPVRKSVPVPIVAQSSRHAQPKRTIVAPKKQEPQRRKSGPIPQIHHSNPQVSQKRIMNHIFDPNKPENNPTARKKTMAGRSFAQQHQQQPDKLRVAWQPHRRNPDGPPIEIELDDCIIHGLPADVAHESEPMSKIVLCLLAEILSLKERLMQLEQGGVPAQQQNGAQPGSASDFAQGEMAKAMQAAAAAAISQAFEKKAAEQSDEG
jgi:hypothetical protein